MLRGSYAGGSLAVTARCPVRRPGPSATLHARVQAPVPRGTLPDLVSAAAIRRATPPPFAALLLLRASALLIAVAWQSAAEPSHFVAAPCFSIAMRRIGLLRLSVAYAAVLCLSLALSRGATPSRDIAFQSRRPANLGGALPSPRRAPQSQAFAARIGPSPLQAAALLRRSCSLPVMAELPNAAAYQSVAGPSRGRSFPCCSFANRFTALLFLRRSRLSHAFPSPRRAKQISSFAALGLAGLLHRNAPPSRRYSGSEPSVHSKRPLPLLRHWPMPRNWP